MINSALTQMVYAANMGDGAPAQTVQAESVSACEALAKDFAAWQRLSGDLPSLNGLLQKYNLAALPTVDMAGSGSGCGR